MAVFRRIKLAERYQMSFTSASSVLRYRIRIQSATNVGPPSVPFFALSDSRNQRQFSSLSLLGPSLDRHSNRRFFRKKMKVSLLFCYTLVLLNGSFLPSSAFRCQTFLIHRARKPPLLYSTSCDKGRGQKGYREEEENFPGRYTTLP